MLFVFLGSATGAFQFIKEIGYIPFETCQPYIACSSDSDEEFCKHIDTSCQPMNICKTCVRNPSGSGGICSQVCKEQTCQEERQSTIVLHSISASFHIFCFSSKFAMFRFHNFQKREVSF